VGIFSYLRWLHYFRSLNFIYDKEFVREHVGDEAASHFFETPALPTLTANDAVHLCDCNTVAAAVGSSKEYYEKRRTYVEATKPNFLAAKTVELLISENTLWKDDQYRSGMNEETYQASFVDPFLDALTGSLKLTRYK